MKKYNTEKARYTSDTMLELSAIPRVGNKIVYNDENQIGQVYQVDEVRFGDNSHTEVYVHRISDLTDYNTHGLITN